MALSGAWSVLAGRGGQRGLGAGWRGYGGGRAGGTRLRSRWEWSGAQTAARLRGCGAAGVGPADSMAPAASV